MEMIEQFTAVAVVLGLLGAMLWVFSATGC